MSQAGYNTSISGNLEGHYQDYDAVPRASVRGSRGEEGKAVKALAKPMGHIEFNPDDFAAIFIETQSPVMQNRMMEIMMSMLREWCSRYDTGIIDPDLDPHYDTLCKAAAIREYLQRRNMWK